MGMVRPEGLEPPAYWFEASRSIQLSYGRVETESAILSRLRVVSSERYGAAVPEHDPAIAMLESGFASA